MNHLHKKTRETSGQVLLIVVLLGLLLVIGGTVVVLFNQTETHHQTASGQRGQNQSVAEEGLSVGIQKLGLNAGVWKNALNGDFSGTDCNTGNLVVGPSGNSFKLFCSTGVATNPGLQTYQVAIIAVGYTNAGDKWTPLRAVRAYVSRRTLGMDSVNNLHVAVALQLVVQPNIQGQLNVHWGPLVCLDANHGASWTLPQPIESQRYPRKFSQGGLTGGLTGTWPRSGSTMGEGPFTDQKEYVAYVPQTFSPVVDETTYRVLASSTDLPTAPTSSAHGPGTPIPRGTDCGNAHSQCAIFKPDVGDLAVFDAISGYSVPAGAVVYVDGDAMFKRINTNGVSGATFIINGNLMLGDPVASGTDIMLHVPVTAPLEYPYSPPYSPPTPPSWPCSTLAGSITSNGLPQYDCDSTGVFTGHVQYRGFLYVKKDLMLITSNWNMVGALLVGDISLSSGRLDIGPGTTLNLAYDDQINHSILVNPVQGSAIKLVPDRVEDVPVF